MLWSEEEQQGSADLRRLRHCAVAVVPAGQPLGHRRDEGDTELAHDAEVARREGVVPHEGVHGRRDVDGLAVVPRAHHAREEVVAQPAGDLARQAELSDEESGGGIRRESTRPCPCNAHGGSGNLQYAIEYVIGICFNLPVISSVMGPGSQCLDSRI